MKVFAVGTSCTWFKRNSTSFIIDDKILFDTPAGSYKDIIKLIDIFKLDGIVLSHFHADHFGDFPVFATRFMRYSERVGRTKNLKVYGQKGVLDKLVAVNTLLGGAEDECDRESLQKFIDFVEVSDGDEFELSGYKIKVFSVDHGRNACLGFVFEGENGKNVGFSADTKECDGLHKILEKSNVAFVDMASIVPAKAHLHCERFVELQNEYPNCRMYPVHTSDECQEFAKNNGLNVLNDFDEIII